MNNNYGKMVVAVLILFIVTLAAILYVSVPGREARRARIQACAERGGVYMSNATFEGCMMTAGER